MAGKGWSCAGVGSLGRLGPGIEVQEARPLRNRVCWYRADLEVAVVSRLFGRARKPLASSSAHPFSRNPKQRPPGDVRIRRLAGVGHIADRGT
ncbi:unnamed protein product [Rangifer tarandus platyrhynchus]|uniref:Uncharacterized protein n=2 Tax=Rangifer tarandus platyrhynchus TaxID=3082113 RepID=A0ABN8XT89_RANTA|nr:unnamed protein product [Rangifer tarandus platyrhynchus]CAI9690332.1 unnamed protein product [Rangifer tarandus platyrhynchus]